AVEVLYGAVGGEEYGREVAGVGIGELARGAVVVGEEERRVFFRRRAAVDVLVEELEQFGGRGMRRFSGDAVGGAESEGADGGVQRGHEQRGGDALAADVAECEAEVVAEAADDEVEVVAGDGARGLADRVDLKAGQSDGRVREEIGLDLAGDGELGEQAFFFALLGEEIDDGGGHAIEGSGECAELVFALDDDAMLKVARVDLAGAAIELRNGVRDGAAEAGGHEEREELQQSEEDGDADEDDAYDRAEAVGG